MKNVELPIGVESFVRLIYEAANNQLEESDPEYVHLLREITAAQKLNLIHPKWDPDSQPVSKFPLSQNWVDLLESTFDLVDSYFLLEQNLVELELAAHATPVNARTVVFLGRGWNIWSQAFIEKAVAAIKRAVKTMDIADNKRKLVDDQILPTLKSAKARFARARNPLVHGGIPVGVNSHKLWEATVTLNFSPSDAIEAYYEDVPGNAVEWARVDRARCQTEVIDVVSESLLLL